MIPIAKTMTKTIVNIAFLLDDFMRTSASLKPNQDANMIAQTMLRFRNGKSQISSFEERQKLEVMHSTCSFCVQK